MRKKESKKTAQEDLTLRNRVFLGVDPGAKGAIAAINSDLQAIFLEDYPGDEVQLVKIINRIYDELTDNGYVLLAGLEKVHSMPKQGVSSSFKFGTNYGIWRGVLASFGIPFLEVTPQKWQKGVISKARDKQPSIAAAGRLFPGVTLLGPKGGKMDGRADALLIAYYIFREYTNG